MIHKWIMPIALLLATPAMAQSYKSLDSQLDSMVIDPDVRSCLKHVLVQWVYTSADIEKCQATVTAFRNWQTRTSKKKDVLGFTMGMSFADAKRTIGSCVDDSGKPVKDSFHMGCKIRDYGVAFSFAQYLPAYPLIEIYVHIPPLCDILTSYCTNAIMSENRKKLIDSLVEQFGDPICFVGDVGSLPILAAKPPYCDRYYRVQWHLDENAVLVFDGGLHLYSDKLTKENEEAGKANARTFQPPKF